MNALLLIALLAQPFTDPHSSSGSVFNSSHRHNDDKECRYGTDTDYWWVYDSGNTQYELNTTNADGGGTDGIVCLVDDGTDDVIWTGGASYSGAFAGTAAADATIIDNNGLVGAQKLTDVAPQGVIIRPQPAFAGGTQTASLLTLCGGQDETKTAIDGADPSVSCAGENDTITVTVIDSNGLVTSTLLTEDQTIDAATDWSASASVANTCTSLAAAVDALAGVGATCTSPDVRFTLDTGTCAVFLAESTAGCTTVTAGTHGGVYFRTGNSTGYFSISRIAGDNNSSNILDGGSTYGVSVTNGVNSTTTRDFTSSRFIAAASTGGTVNGSVGASGITSVATITSSATGSLGWAVVDGTDNTACTAQCTSAAVFGFDLAGGATAPVLVGPSDATADICLCAGSS